MSLGGNRHNENIPHFDVKISEENMDKIVRNILKDIKKDWDLNILCRHIFTDGLTNKLFGYYEKTKGSFKEVEEQPKPDVVMVRINGAKTDSMIDRQKELRNIRELAKNKVGVRLYATFKNGFCYKYVSGKTLTREDFTKKEIFKSSAEYLAKVHSMKISDSYKNHHKMESTTIDSIKEFIEEMPEKFDSIELQARYEKEVPSKEELQKEVGILTNAISKLGHLTVSYCHNDLHPGNCLFNEMKEKIFGIDYEYGGPNYVAYDIANHFNEMCGCDFESSYYPKKDTQFWWLRKYLENINELNGGEAEFVREETVQEWFKHVETMSLVSHLFWGTWGFIQAYYSNIDFDYLDYGIRRLNEYFKRKNELLGNDIL